MIGIYHNRDLDGYASGAIIKEKYPNVKLIGWDYGTPFKANLKGEEVIMADVSFPIGKMLEAAELTNGKFTWIDHHISQIKEYKEYVENNGEFCTAVLENGIAACEGTWKYLFPGKELPLAIKLLGEYDTFRNQDVKHWEEMVMPFQYGMKGICSSAENFPTELFTNDSLVEKIIKDGEVIWGYQKNIDTIQCMKSSFECTFEGLRAVCLNGSGFSTLTFEGVYDEEKHDLMIPFQYNGRQWIISLYTTKDEIDCSKMAKQRGGGGHKKAAGFQADRLEDVFKNLK